MSAIFIVRRKTHRGFVTRDTIRSAWDSRSEPFQLLPRESG